MSTAGTIAAIRFPVPALPTSVSAPAMGGGEAGHRADPVDSMGPAVTTLSADLGNTPLAKDVQKHAQDAMFSFLGLRIPTTTPQMSEERRQQILAVVQPGDILLETNDAYPQWQRLEYAAMKSHFSHAAIYEGDGKFLEATGPVQRTDLKEYLHGPLKFAVVRPPYKTPEDIQAALDYCRGKLGTPYNDSFVLDSGEGLYCSEMVYNALKAMPNPIVSPLTTTPAGRPAVAPDAFLQIPGAQAVYNDGSNFWANQLTHWPVAAGAIGTAAVAAALGGPIAGVAGFAGGLAASILLGNKIQTGKFTWKGDGHT